MWIRSAADKTTGMVKVTCWNYTGEVFYTAEFDNVAEAETAGADAERRMIIWEMSGRPVPTTLDEMTDDELLAELLA